MDTSSHIPTAPTESSASDGQKPDSRFTPNPPPTYNTPWTAHSYGRAVNMSGAVKLACSGVAPLVAAARGYESVDSYQAKDFAKQKGIGDGRTKAGGQFLASFRDGGDILTMPWFRADQLKASPDQFVKLSASGLQMRPQNPRSDPGTGRPVKYEFLVGQPTVLDFHPAVLRSWVASAPRVMLAEGLLKGDSALTALLSEHVRQEELALLSSDENPVNAMKRLAAIMEDIPQEDRVSIISLAGVGNWRNNPEWNAIDLRDKEVLVAFDGDVTTNWNVWNMAERLCNFLEQSKKATPRLVQIDRFPGIEAELAEDPHFGLDDFFHKVGDWSDLEQMMVDSLPERPPKPDDNREGEWRVAADGLSVEECVPTFTDEGVRSGVQWSRRSGIGGRVTHTEVRRASTDEEQSSGIFGKGVEEGHHEETCAVELRWFDDVFGEERSAIVTGPNALLGYPPAEWHRRGALIPADLMLHPEWPPKFGGQWLQAIKGHERQRQEKRTVWTTMGWVPVPGEKSQAFIAGDSVIAASDPATKQIRVGVTERELAGSSKFGLPDTFRGRDFIDPAGEFNAADDLETIMNDFVTRGPWTTTAVALTMLALALRPTVPIPSSIAAYFVGAPAKGKTWSAIAVMSFWQKRPGGWVTLPGSAEDTFASTENAVSKTPIWVADDLAPSTDKFKADATLNSIGLLVRAVFNRIGKRRMNFDLTSKEVPTPMAVFILTAENEHSTQSVRERAVRVEFAGLSSPEAIERVNRLSEDTLTASRITGAVLRAFILDAEETGWSTVVQEWNATRKGFAAPAREVLEEMGIQRADMDRPVRIASDLMLGLQTIRRLAEKLGLGDLVELFHWSQGGYYRLLTEQVAQVHIGKQTMQPGAVLIDAIRQSLASGHGYIENLDMPGFVPSLTGVGPSDLGWKMGEKDYKPCGPKIGFATTVLPQGASERLEVVFLFTDEAFNVAQKHHSARIQHGASPATSWKNARESGLAHPHYRSQMTRGYKAQVNRAQAKLDGFPVSIDTLFAGAVSPDTPTD